MKMMKAAEVLMNASNEIVYGSTFSSYSHQEFDEFLGFFERRLFANGIDPAQFFEGKVCLDAGCGGGRGSMLMLKYGAKKVIGVDQSIQNLEGFGKRLTAPLRDKFTPLQSDLEDFDIGEEVDFVWFSGVIQHTIEPCRVFRSVYSKLKLGGGSFFYAYGRDGIYWELVKLARAEFASISDVEMLALLRDLGLENRYIAEYMDDWKVPYLRAYTDIEMREAFSKLGLSPSIRLFWGEPYDTCMRPRVHPSEANLWGEGDLRYFMVKSEQPDGEIQLARELDANETIVGAANPIYAEYLKKVRDKLATYEEPRERVNFLAKVQHRLRDTMSGAAVIEISTLEEGVESI